jgi:hypothetical protein
MEFKTENFGGASFIVPDKPTVFQLADYDSRRYELKGFPAAILLWQMAQALITEWECKSLPIMDSNLREITENANDITSIIEWAGTTVSAYRRSLDEISKNS